MSAPSAYIAYARALNTLDWSPAEFLVADTFAARLIGMLRMPPYASNGAPHVMAFPNCSSVHTCFMPYPLDIAFIDRGGRVLALHEDVGPWRLCSHDGAWAVLERASALRDFESGLCALA